MQSIIEQRTNMSCKEIHYCAFYKKHLSDKNVKTAFINNACEKDGPCVGKLWKKQTGKDASEDLSPAGTYIAKK